METLNYKHILTYNGVSKTLDAAPAGWDEWTRRYYRHSTFHGIIQVPTNSQRFVLTGGYKDSGGYYFIQDAFELEGVNAVIYYTRKRLDDFEKEYVSDYDGILDLSPEGGYSEESEWIEVKAIESSKLQSLIANKSIDYDLNSLTATNGNTITSFSDSPKRCTISEVNIYLEALCTASSVVVDSISSNISDTTSFNRDYEINRIGERVIETFNRNIYENTSDETINLTLELTASSSYSTTFFPNTPITNNGGSIDVRTYFIIKNSDGDEILNVELDQHSESVSNLTEDETINAGEDITYSLSEYSMLSGYYIELIMEYSASVDRLEIDYSWGVSVSELQMYETSVYLESDAYGYLAHETAQRLIQLITGETDVDKLLYAEILGRSHCEFQQYVTAGALAYINTTSAWALRNYPEYTIKVNFEDWFKTLNYMGNIALWYDKLNDVFRIEEKEQVYRNEEILNIGEVKNLKKTIHSESYFSIINSGATEKGDYEEDNGVSEYNIQSNHSMDMPSTNVLDIRAIYNIDSLSIIFSKLDGYYAYGSTDTKYDDKIMLFEVDSNLTAVQNSSIGTFGGFLGADERLNGNYTPKKNIIKNGNWIGSSLYKYVDGVIQFTSNVKDTILTYDGVSEDDDITKTELGEPLYYPEVYDFDGYVDHSIIEQLNLDPHGYITFYDEDGNEYKGFILEVEIQDYNRTATYKLLKLNPNR